jgi:single-stranded DNA-binding protein
MLNLNRVYLAGRMDGPPQVERGSAGTRAFFQLTVARYRKVQDRWVQEEMALPIESYNGRVIERLTQDYYPGMIVFLEGRLFSNQRGVRIVMDKFQLISQETSAVGPVPEYPAPSSSVQQEYPFRPASVPMPPAAPPVSMPPVSTPSAAPTTQMNHLPPARNVQSQAPDGWEDWASGSDEIPF